MAKKRRSKRKAAVSRSLTIAWPLDGDDVTEDFTVLGVFNPYGMDIRAQVRTTDSDDPSAGDSVSMLFEDNQAGPGSDPFFFWFEEFVKHDDPNSYLDPDTYYLHVWGYDSDSDPAANFVAHHGIEITIPAALAAKRRARYVKRKATKPVLLATAKTKKKK